MRLGAAQKRHLQSEISLSTVSQVLGAFTDGNTDRAPDAEPEVVLSIARKGAHMPFWPQKFRLTSAGDELRAGYPGHVLDVATSHSSGLGGA